MVKTLSRRAPRRIARAAASRNANDLGETHRGDSTADRARLHHTISNGPSETVAVDSPESTHHGNAIVNSKTRVYGRTGPAPETAQAKTSACRHGGISTLESRAAGRGDGSNLAADLDPHPLVSPLDRRNPLQRRSFRRLGLQPWARTVATGSEKGPKQPLNTAYARGIEGDSRRRPRFRRRDGRGGFELSPTTPSWRFGLDRFRSG